MDEKYDKICDLAGDYRVVCRCLSARYANIGSDNATRTDNPIGNDV